MKKDQAKAFAPATVANVAVGFDLLGFPIEGVGDFVTVKRISKPEVIIKKVSGVQEELPLNPEDNTAGMSLIKMIEKMDLDFGFEVSIEKGIPISSGMGGSAASAVGAVVAANELLETPLLKDQLLTFALEGEAVASGSKHADNVAPCLHGGLTLCLSMDPIQIIEIPVPKDIYCVLVYPKVKMDTKEARSVLKKEIPLSLSVKQSAMLSGFLSGCYTGNLDLIRSSMNDLIIEPQRSSFIPGFDQAKKDALVQGALGFSISGAGSSVFAWACSQENAKNIENAIVKQLEKENEVKSWVSPINLDGAHVLPD